MNEALRNALLKLNDPHLITAIMDELEDANYQSRTHGKRSTVRDGCQGPLCKKIGRDIARRKYAAKHPDPLRARGQRAPELDSILDIVIEAHADQRQLDRVN